MTEGYGKQRKKQNDTNHPTETNQIETKSESNIWLLGFKVSSVNCTAPEAKKKKKKKKKRRRKKAQLQRINIPTKRVKPAPPSSHSAPPPPPKKKKRKKKKEGLKENDG